MSSKILKSAVLVFFSALLFSASLCSAATNLDGRILLQVQDKGQAWYVNPLNHQRYYLGRPDDAFLLMRSLGLGVTNADLVVFQNRAPLRLAGRILLQVQDKGQAYYLSPTDLKLYYLGRPADAFNLMRAKGLGITNFDLAKIVIFENLPAVSPASPVSSASSTAPSFSFKYGNNNYAISQALSLSLYNSYQNSPKVYTYSGATEPANLREAFYGLFLAIKPGDNTLSDIAAKLTSVAANNNWNSDQLAEFALAFVQYIPYDHAKLVASGDRNNNPYYPYETLYLDRGVCSDKTFLAVALLRKLGYGAAIFDFPDHNHSALGIACPTEYSINGSGYCYGETTNYFPLGVIPQSINSGQATSSDDGFANLFNSANLGQIEIYQKSAGKIYSGMPALYDRVTALQTAKNDIATAQTEINNLEIGVKAKETELTALKSQMDAYYNNGQIPEYNNLVASYNDLVNKYNAALAVYRDKINAYNQKVVSFNQAVKDFYQK